MSHFCCNQDTQSTCGGAQPRYSLLSRTRGAFLSVRDAIIPENFTFMSNEHTRGLVSRPCHSVQKAAACTFSIVLANSSWGFSHNAAVLSPQAASLSARICH